MKKLIISSLIAVMGVMANAASADWSAADIYGYSTGAYAPSTYLIFAFDTSALARDAAIAQFTSADFSNVNLGFAADDYDSGEAVGSITGYANGAPVNAYLVVFNSDDMATATHVFVSGVESTSIGVSGQSAYPSFDMATTADAANWAAISTEPTPEPTSGLLLLLGMASLALKRKVA